jgi:hypothetical protein
MADRIACSCVTCPQCGAWIVVQGGKIAGVSGKGLPVRITCTVPECAREFSFDGEDTQVFEVPLPLFERRYFYRSELSPPS